MEKAVDDFSESSQTLISQLQQFQGKGSHSCALEALQEVRDALAAIESILTSPSEDSTLTEQQVLDSIANALGDGSDDHRSFLNSIKVYSKGQLHVIEFVRHAEGALGVARARDLLPHLARLVRSEDIRNALLNHITAAPVLLPRDSMTQQEAYNEGAPELFVEVPLQGVGWGAACRCGV